MQAGTPRIQGSGEEQIRRAVHVGVETNCPRDFCLGGPSPSPDEPTNKFRPSVNVMMLPLALLAPSFAWNPSTRISVPAGNEFLVQPRRSSALGAAASIIQLVSLPSSPLTSMWIQAWGLIH